MDEFVKLCISFSAVLKRLKSILEIVKKALICFFRESAKIFKEHAQWFNEFFAKWRKNCIVSSICKIIRECDQLFG